jgi:2-(1,2-epoxy-1,2-dihydrophenyl)acetyl-CoA isomerase
MSEASGNTRELVRVLVDERVALLTLNRPERMNAVTPELFSALSDAVAQVATDDIRVVVLTGEGRGFCAGADLKAPRPALQPGSRRLRQLYHPVIAQISQLRKPVIAAVNGPAVGAGLSLAAAADIRIASQDAVFVPGFVDVGLAPDNGASWHLPRIIGHSRAALWLLSGSRMDATQALEWGLVDEVAPAGSSGDRAMELARTMAAKPGVGMIETLLLLRSARGSTLAEQLEWEGAASDRATDHPERLAARAAKSASLRT